MIHSTSVVCEVGPKKRTKMSMKSASKLVTCLIECSYIARVSTSYLWDYVR